MGKKKGKAASEDGGREKDALPPPPNFDAERQGAVEALLSFKIRGMEEVIEDVSEEAEANKDRVHQQKDRNYILKKEQTQHLKTLLGHAMAYEKKLAGADVVTKEEVEHALLEKFEFENRSAAEIERIEESIEEADEELEVAAKELSRLKRYKDTSQHKQLQYIQSMQDHIAEMSTIERDLAVKLQEDLEKSQIETDKNAFLLSELEKEKTSERLLQDMNEETKGEIADNMWLKKQISVLKDELQRLEYEVGCMEQRNLQMIKTVSGHHHREMENSQRLFALANQRRYTPLLSIDGSASGDQTDSRTRTASSRQIDLGLLAVEGSRARVRHPQDVTHLPPIDRQHGIHAQVLDKMDWPITTHMLKLIT